MIALPDHPHRYSLTNELHARPFADMHAPERASHLALLTPDGGGEDERAHVAALCDRFGIGKAPEGATHFLFDFGSFRLKWERHTEFTTYTFFCQGPTPAPFAEPAISRVPADWLRAVPGEVLIAMHVVLGQFDEADLKPEALSRYFVLDSLCCARMFNGLADVWTDFRIHEDGFSRLLVNDRGLAPRQAGRLVQRLLELRNYQKLAWLALPLARQASPVIARIDGALAELTSQMKTQTSMGDEQGLLDSLMNVSAEIEASIAATSYRFSAAQAYNALVGERLSELREESIATLSTLGEFIERRLAPAMRTCESVAARQEVLSERATRAANLLRTRVDIALERQNRDLLASMDRRGRLQLRLQQTVEGLSVAAITYYVVSLVGYLVKPLESGVPAVDADIVRGIAIPVVALLAWLGVRLVRKAIDQEK